VSIPGNALFIICALLALLSAIGTIAVKSPIRAAMSLLVHIVSLSGLFLTLHAHLLAILQVLVYAGAVVVLFVFVIMMIGPNVADTPTTRGLVTKAAASAVMALMTFGLVAAFAMAAPQRPEITACEGGQANTTDCKQFGGVAAFSHDLYGAEAVPFELMSVLLTVAIIGAIAVARGRSAEEAAAHNKRRAEQKAEAAAQTAREQKLAAEVAASGGH
jgi:NADH-quinone oxidoreductase subunit J